jgi:CubicO group peptidase (beta-lactamase class C family)
MLLSMSSGICDEAVTGDFYTLYSFNTDPAAGRRYLLDVLSHHPLDAEPGTTYFYSNIGYAFAGLMLEVAWRQFSGETITYEQLIQQKLFDPLGITTASRGVPGISATVPTNLPAPNPSSVAIGHNAATNVPVDGLPLGAPVGLGYVDADNPLCIIPAGAWAMSIDDYIRLLVVQMQTNQSTLLNNLGLRIETLNDIRTPVTPIPSEPFSFSLGWVVDDADSNHFFYTGSNERWRSKVDMRLGTQVGLVAACNQGACGDALEDAIAVLAAVPGPGDVLVQSILLDDRFSNTASETIAFVTNMMVADGIANASLALVASNHIAWFGCFGYENRETGIPVSTVTVFRIGSVSKVFATLAALQLCDQGVLSLATTVHACLPEFSLRPRATYPPSSAITLRQLLGYHSGIPGDLFRFGDLTVPFGDFSSIALNYLPSTYLLYPTDHVNSYCNTAFTLAEMIVGRMNTSGVSYVSYCDHRIFRPLGMDSTSFFCDKPVISNHLAVSYLAGEPLPPEYVNAHGSGGMYSTPRDLAQFLMAILAGGEGPEGRLISADALNAMLTPQGTNLPLNIDNLYVAGLGWDSVANPRLDYAGRVCFKTGNTALFSAFIEALLDQQLAVAFVHTGADGRLSIEGTDYLLRRAVRDKVNGIPIPPDVAPAFAPLTNAPSVLLDAAEGLYADDSDITLVAATNGTLTLVRNVATAPFVTTGIVFRTNGWFSSPASQDHEFRFTNLAGRAVMVCRDIAPDRSFLHHHLGGERIASPILSAAWSNRLDRAWPLLDEHADFYGFTMPVIAYRMMLRQAGACLVMKEFNGASHVLIPESDALAFVVGIVKRSDSAVQFYLTNGVSVAQFAGTYYQDPDTIPLIAVGATVTGAVVLDYSSAFYALDLGSNEACMAQVDMAPASFCLAALDDQFRQIAATNAHAPLWLTAPHAGRYYLKVQAPVTGPSTGSFVLSTQIPEPTMLILLAPLAAVGRFCRDRANGCGD